MPYANNNGVKIYYEVEGQGPPLVMLHGFAGSLEDWREAGYVDALKNDYQLVLGDLIGHGKSDKPHDTESYALEKYPGNLTAILDGLHIPSAHFMGYSGGGVHCIALASQARDRVKSMILMASGPHTTNTSFIRPIVAAGPEAYIAMMEQSGPMPAGLKKRMMANDFKALTAIIDSLSTPLDLTGKLPGMLIPFLVLLGENDFAYPPQKEKELFQHVPDLNFVVLPRLDHGTIINRSDMTLPYIKKFLAQVNTP